MKNTKKLVYILSLTVLLFLPLLLSAQKDDIPDASPRLVNDYVGFLSSDQQEYLERKLVAFDDSTSTQITIVIVKSLNGYEPNEYATMLGQKWGVGHKENQRNNGIVILVKPKTSEENGQFYIATGYGMESFVTDALAKRITEEDVLPAFRNGHNFEGLNKAVDVLMAISKGQFTVDQYMKKKARKKDTGIPAGAIIIIVIIVVLIFSRGSRGGGSRHISTGGLPLWMLLSGMGSGRSGGSFGGFSSGGGGFGGFGGGSFGGGGAGGSW